MASVCAFASARRFFPTYDPFLARRKIASVCASVATTGTVFLKHPGAEHECVKVLKDIEKTTGCVFHNVSNLTEKAAILTESLIILIRKDDSLINKRKRVISSN